MPTMPGHIIFTSIRSPIVCLILLFTTEISKTSQISCLNEHGNAVDWWIVYKLPDINDHPSREIQQGVGYLYLDDRKIKWTLGKDSINNSRNAVGRTIGQLNDHRNDRNVYRLLYNDQHPDEKKDGYRGHTKGVQLFDSSLGFWLVHSVPEFPKIGAYSYPESGTRNGQSMLCISFPSEILSKIGEQLILYQPSIYNSQLPNNFAKKYPSLKKVIDKKSIRKGPFSKVAELTSAYGTRFINFAKHKKWSKDLYSDMVAPKLHQSLYVETWLNGPGDLPSVCKPKYKVHNIRTARPDGIEFQSSKDHSKWVVAKDEVGGYVCIGDINRQKSQDDRGGGTICIRNDKLWLLFRNSVGQVECCPNGLISINEHGNIASKSH